MARRKKRATPLDRVPRNAAEVAALWRLFLRRRSVRLRNRLAAYYRPAAQRTVLKVLNTLPAHVDRDAMTSAIDEVLLRLIETFDPTRQRNFTRYMLPRLFGAVLDAARQADTATRLARSKVKGHAARVVALEQRLGRCASTEEIEAHCGRRPCVPRMQSLDAPNFATSCRPLSESLPAMPSPRANEPFWKYVLSRLSCQAFVVVSLHFRFGVRKNQIAEVVGLSKTRISQIIAEALCDIRSSASDPTVREAIREHFGRHNGAILADS